MNQVRKLSEDQFSTKRLQAPMHAAPPPERTFDLALVTAGAVSGGAYQAGVLDFLVEALDRWYAAKAAGEDVPQHDVRLRVVAGASAGGINSALLAIAANWGFQPQRADALPSVWGEAARDKPSPFHSIWVDGVDISDLLTTDDLDGSTVPSLLNAGYLEKVLVPRALAFQGTAVAPEQRRFRAWLSDPLPVQLTVTNLKGVPYEIAFNTELAGPQGETAYHMMLHKDFMAFTVSGVPGTPTEQRLPGYAEVQAPNGPDAESWKPMGRAALATSAFPVGLAPVALHRPYKDYQFRIGYRDETTQEVSYVEPSELPPDYPFACVDGGVMNNEPFDLARAVLFGSADGEESDGRKSDRGVVMLEAFPTSADLFEKLDPNIVESLMQLMSAQIQQARFKLEDLIFASRDDVFSRFLIKPVRPGTDPSKLTLASAPLGAFFGFFSRAFREHDFRLGRRNCQDFLRHRLKLPIDNPVMRGAGAADAQGLVPLIPLVGPCRNEEPIPEWPAGAFTVTSDLQRAIRNRLDKIADYAIRRYFDRSTLVRLLWTGIPFRKGLRAEVLDYIDRTLSEAARQVDAAK